MSGRWAATSPKRISWCVVCGSRFERAYRNETLTDTEECRRALLSRAVKDVQADRGVTFLDGAWIPVEVARRRLTQRRKRWADRANAERARRGDWLGRLAAAWRMPRRSALHRVAWLRKLGLLDPLPRLCRSGRHAMEGDNVLPSTGCRACHQEKRAARDRSKVPCACGKPKSARSSTCKSCAMRERHRRDPLLAPRMGRSRWSR